MRFRSLASPQKLLDGSYGVLCMVTGRYGLYRSMARFKRLAEAKQFYSEIEGFEWG
jgi:hypothetical protein